MRVLVLALFLSSALGLYVRHSAQARMTDMMRAAGKNLMAYGKGAGTHDGNASTLYVNGAALKFSVGTTKDAVDTVLDAFEARCNAKDGLSVNDYLRKEHRREVTKLGTWAKLLRGTMRQSADDLGFVACFDTGSTKSLGLKDWVDRLKQMAQSGDLNDLGKFRYAFAQKGQYRTRIFSMWSDGAFNIAKMFPRTGDAPGEDVQDAPRPPKMRRIFSSSQAYQPYSVTVYAGAQQDAESMIRDYETRLRKLGWKVSPPQKTNALTAQRGQRLLQVSAGQSAEDESVLTLVHSGEAPMEIQTTSLTKEMEQTP